MRRESRARVYAPRVMTARSTLTGIVLGLLLGACGSVGDGAVDAGIPVQDATVVTEGELLYQANCALCHGSDLRGTDQGPSHLSEVYVPSHHADGAFVLAVQVGTRAHHWNFGDMLPIDGLSSEDVEAIVAYVREQQRIEGFEPYPP